LDLSIRGRKRYLRPQVHWLKSNTGQINLDFIGGFETLREDFQTVCKKIGASEVSLPHLLSGGIDGYERHYDQESRDYVGKIFEDEIKLFNYKF